MCTYVRTYALVCTVQNMYILSYLQKERFIRGITITCMYYIEYKVSSAIATDTNKQSTYIRTYAYACMYVFWPPNKFVCMYAICICMYVFWPPNKFVCMYAIYIICMYVRMYFGHQTNLFVCMQYT
jgi:hypothetical protein